MKMMYILLFLTGFNLQNHEPGPDPTPVKEVLAKVNRVDGMYIFIESQPTLDYTVLGTVKKTGLTWSGSLSERYHTITKKALKDYPDAEGIIFDDINLERATCIKFK